MQTELDEAARSGATPDAAIDAVSDVTLAEAISTIELPPVPAELRDAGVAAWSEPLLIDSYLPLAPDALPAFLEQRVYQGSSGRVYPLPFHERISQTKAPHAWQAVHLENQWVRLVILPELGGRIHIGYDKVADYDFFYRNNVIKPALVGLAGPWISGGIEFNWPQHHRPATFLPTDFEIEHEDDGAVTVWCSDHDPFTRMKGMHGIRLRPDSAAIEARVRLYNRTDETQTFLWWANVAAAVDDEYQAFFPTDVRQVADHAKRATASYPAVADRYYGVDYPAQKTDAVPDGDRLDWYRNIPVPTSYMVTETDDDFFGGYDHGRDAGFVYWADRHVAPGKKLWTWGDAPFGHAWDASLTDTDGPYIELMAGAFTDNQPDFSYLAPGETKTFSQYWYPIHWIGPAHQATNRVAVSLAVTPAAADATTIRIGVAAAEVLDGCVVELRSDADGVLNSTTHDLAPGVPLLETLTVTGHHASTALTLTVRHADTELISWRPRPVRADDGEIAGAATEPPLPADIDSIDELFFTGQYLHQYRHANRFPEPYWREALRRDPNDVRSNVALSERLVWAGADAEAERLLRTAIDRLVSRVSNPADGEAHYRLGILLERQGRDAEALGYLAKATWNSAWRVPAHFALARLKARAGDFAGTESDLREVLRLDASHLQAADLLTAVLRRLGRAAEAASLVQATLTTDPLDQWARDLAGLPLSNDAPTLLDVALDYARAGLNDDALRVLDAASAASAVTALGQVQVGPLVQYHRAALLAAAGLTDQAAAARTLAQRVDAEFCQASRHDDVRVLKAALAADPTDALAATLLGNWHYDKRSYATAIALWEQALHADAAGSATVTATSTGASALGTQVIAHRNLGIAAYNVHADAEAARRHYAEARSLAPTDAKLLYEADQLAARLGESADKRRGRLAAEIELVSGRDDLTVVYANLLTETGDPATARDLLAGRSFQPWEGGEGQALGAWDAAHLALAERALAAGEAAAAVQLIDNALLSPASLGEARHPLANSARLYLQRGDALAAVGDTAGAEAAWGRSAAFRGDFLQMSVQPFSTQSYYSVLALQRLGRLDEVEELTFGLAAYVDELSTSRASIDYFATSLPTMLLFTDDPQAARDAEIVQLREQLHTLGSLLPIPAAP